MVSEFFREQRRKEAEARQQEGIPYNAPQEKVVVEYLRTHLSEEHCNALEPFEVIKLECSINGAYITGFDVKVKGASGAQASVQYP